MDDADRQRRLGELRQKVRQVDDRLLELISERLEHARRIGELKVAAQLPIKDYKVEKDVVERSRARARELGLYEELAEEVTKLLIKYSVAAQDALQQRSKRKQAAPETKRILVAGGRGRMGRWLSEYFESFGHAVSHVDTGAAPGDGPWPLAGDLAAAAAQSDVVVLSTPISATPGLLDALTAAKVKALVFDICSLKSPLLPALKRAADAGLKVASAHPMFGPQVDVLAGRNILVCPVRDPQAAAETRALFEGTTASLVSVPVERHDELMSYVLGLSHLVNLVFARVLAASGLPFPDLKAVASTTFNAQLGVVEPVVHENRELYYEIQAENAYTPELIEQLRAGLDDYAKATLGREREAFCRLMDEGRRYLDNTPPSC